MAQTDSSERSISERVVKQAVERGLETPMREPILEAVDDSEKTPGRRRRQLPLAGLLVGIGAAIGYAAARSSDLDEIVSPEIPETVEEELEARDVDVMDNSESSGGSGLLRKGLLAVGLIGAAVFLRRRFGGGDEPEWEPIEEFEPAPEANEEFAGPAGTTDVEEADIEEEGETAEATDEEE